MKMLVGKIVSVSILGSFVAATALTAPDLTVASTSGLAKGSSDQASAQTSRTMATSSQGDGAFVAKGLPCEIPVPGVPEVITTTSHTVITPSGNIAISCHARTTIVVPMALVVQDAPCGTIGPAGTDSHLVVTPSGRANFWCHHHR
jgi:hypothetical protein